MSAAAQARAVTRSAGLGSGAGYAISVLILIVITVVRLFPAYTTFTATYDEPFQIASGMEWLDKGTYTYEWQHLPLARVAVAAGPYLKGLRSQSLRVPNQEGNAILHSDGQYWENLTLARLGTLPFLVLACIVVYLWGCRWYSVATGFWAVLLLLSVPPILGHAGLATLDMACAATIAAVLYQFVRWLECPSKLRSAFLGRAIGVAFLTKFSSLPFFGVCCGAFWRTSSSLGVAACPR